MDVVIEILAMVTVSVVVLFFIPLPFLIIYLIKRNKFYYPVNCWFCNAWTRVLYSERNSFCCPFCFQYNGFNKDGDYNQEIEAQFDISLRKNPKTVENSTASSNGLCARCNYNQQLKVRQLANFVPLHEENYDIEVEHFRAEIEKSYKLCRKCEKVLRNTIGKQQANILGNYIRHVHKNGLGFLSIKKSTGYSIKCINFIRNFLALIAVIILCHALNAKLNLTGMLKKFIPGILANNMVFLNDWWLIILNIKETMMENMCNKFNLFLTPDLRDAIIKNNILLVTCIGLMLEGLLLICQPKSSWKAKKLMGWIVLLVTPLYIVQIISATAIIYSHLKTYQSINKRFSLKTKCVFKKLNKNINDDYSSDEELSEESLFHSNNSRKGRNPFQEVHQSKNFFTQNKLHNPFNNNMFSSSGSTNNGLSNPNTTYRGQQSTRSNYELHNSLENLHLSNTNFKPPISSSRRVFTTPVNSVNRPILSPPKLNNIAQNSWNTFPFSTNMVNQSRSSSVSSGYVSSDSLVLPKSFNSHPSPMEVSPCDEFASRPLLSRPSFHFTSMNSSVNPVQPQHNFSWNTPHTTCLPQTNQLYPQTHNNVFHPMLNQNQLMHQARVDPMLCSLEGSLSNLSVENIREGTNIHNLQLLYGEKPVISSLFRGIQGIKEDSYIFRDPNV